MRVLLTCNRLEMHHKYAVVFTLGVKTTVCMLAVWQCLRDTAYGF